MRRPEFRFQVVQESVQSRNMTQRSQHEGDQHKKDKISDAKAQKEKGQSLTRSRNGQRDRTGVSSAAANGPAPPTPLISTKTGPVPQKCTIRTHEIFSACCQWEAIPDLCPPPPLKKPHLSVPGMLGRSRVWVFVPERREQLRCEKLRSPPPSLLQLTEDLTKAAKTACVCPPPPVLNKEEPRQQRSATAEGHQ